MKMAKINCNNEYALTKIVQDPRLERAKLAMFDRFKMLGVFVLFAIIIVIFAAMFIGNIVTSIATYNSMVKRNGDTKTGLSGSAAISNPDYDSEVYDDDKDIKLVDEYNEFKKNMARIKQLYSDYNSKVTAYQRSMNQEPTDVIDEKIMLRQHDNY